jgi:hypothetical protein
MSELSQQSSSAMRSFNEVAADIIGRCPACETLVEEWFALLAATRGDGRVCLSRTRFYIEARLTARRAKKGGYLGVVIVGRRGHWQVRANRAATPDNRSQVEPLWKIGYEADADTLGRIAAAAKTGKEQRS